MDAKKSLNNTGVEREEAEQVNEEDVFEQLYGMTEEEFEKKIDDTISLSISNTDSSYAEYEQKANKTEEDWTMEMSHMT